MTAAILITNSYWQEPPRIRHQVANLLLSHGVEVAFFERPQSPWVRQASPVRRVSSTLSLVSTKGLLHPQLRVVPPLAWANSEFSAAVYHQRVAQLGWRTDATIINFMHDGSFLRRVFPTQRLITLVHDDFEAQSHFPWFGHVTRALRATCKVSDQVLAVSTPLVDRLQQWANCELFLPWAVRPYSVPLASAVDRTTLLFWGSVDTAIDLSIVRRLSEECVRRGPQWQLLFVGPTERADRRRLMLGALGSLPQVRIQGTTPLEELPLDSVLAAIIPYGGAPHTRAITMANKTLQLLSCGLPLLIAGMPSFVKQPFIVRLDQGADIPSAIDQVQAAFATWQPAIENFVRSQRAEDRLRQLGFASALSA